MTNRILSGVAGIVVLTLVGALFMGTVSAAVEITEYPSYTTGDYFNYDLDASGLVQSMKKQFGEDSNIQIEKSTAKMTVSGAETLTIEGKTYDCIVLTMLMDVKMSISGTYLGQSYTGDMHMINTMKTWQTQSDAKIVKEESTNHQYMNMSISGQNMNQETKDINDAIYEPPVSEYKIPVKVGDEWSTQTNKKIHRIQMQRSSGGAWQKTETNTTENTTMEYQAVSEEKITVKAGTFDVLKIKESEQTSDNYMYEYLTSNGIVVKLEMYSGNETMMTAELSSYNMGENGSSGGGGIPGFEAATMIAGISLVTIGYAYRKRK